MSMQTLTALNFNSEDLKISQHTRPRFHQVEDQSPCSNLRSNFEKQKPTWLAARQIVFYPEIHSKLMPQKTHIITKQFYYHEENGWCLVYAGPRLLISERFGL